MALTSFNLYYSFLDGFEVLTDAEAGRLIKGAIRYAESGTDPNFSGNERYIWAVMKSRIDRDKAAYIVKCEKNRANVSTRYESTETTDEDTNVYERIRTNTTATNTIQSKAKQSKVKQSNANIYNKGFTPPTIDEVRAYCIERNNGIDPASFVDYYASQKWKKANGRPVADWRACVRQWEQKRKGEQPTPGEAPSALMLKGIRSKRNPGVC